MISLNVEVNADALADGIHKSMDRDEIINLIKELDSLEQDYEFTEELRDYFINEIKKEDSAVDNKN